MKNVFRKSTIFVVLLSVFCILPLGAAYAQHQAPQFENEQQAHN